MVAASNASSKAGSSYTWTYITTPKAKLKKEAPCLDCAKDATWSMFKAAMLQHHGVIVPDQHKPKLAA